MMRHVLTVVHSEAMTNLIKTVLGQHYRLSPSKNVFEAMKILIARPDIRLIIIDIDDHSKECIDFILHLHSSKLYRKPVIVLSNAVNQKTFASELQAVVLMYFIKPFNPIELVQSIKILDDIESLPFSKNHQS